MGGVCLPLTSQVGNKHLPPPHHPPENQAFGIRQALFEGIRSQSNLSDAHIPFLISSFRNRMWKFRDEIGEGESSFLHKGRFSTGDRVLQGIHFSC